MKKFENLGRRLSKDEQKAIMGGDPPGPGCLTLSSDCNDNVQCCSNNCATSEGSSTGKKCKNSL